MKHKIKNLFIMLWNDIRLPFLRLSTKKINKILTLISEKDKANLLTEKNVEFLKSLGIDTNLKRLRKKCKSGKI